MMKKFLFITFLILAFTNVGMCTTQDGVIDRNSTGTIDISITIPKMIMINGLEDMTIAENAIVADNIVSSGINTFKNICVSSNMHTDETYNVTATDSNGSGESETAFHLVNTEAGATSEYDVLEYTVKFNDVTGTQGNKLLTYGTAETGFKADGGGFQDTCTTRNASVQILFSNTELHRVRHGTYTGTLTLVVAPDL